MGVLFRSGLLLQTAFLGAQGFFLVQWQQEKKEWEKEKEQMQKEIQDLRGHMKHWQGDYTKAAKQIRVLNNMIDSINKDAEEERETRKQQLKDAEESHGEVVDKMNKDIEKLKQDIEAARRDRDRMELSASRCMLESA